MKNCLLIPFFFLSINSFAQLVGDRTHQQLSKNRSLETSLYMLHQWADSLDLTRQNKLAEIAHSVFSAEKESGFDKLLIERDYRTWVEKEETMLLGGPVWGNVTFQGADLWFAPPNLPW